MAFIKYNPGGRNCEDNSFSKMVDKFFNDSLTNTTAESQYFSPKVDISETKNDFQIELAVPGMKKEDFVIDMKDDQLTISGERKRIDKNEEKSYHSLETSYGKFSRSFYLPEHIKAEKIDATYAEGILKISIPKDEKKETKLQYCPDQSETGSKSPAYVPQDNKYQSGNYDGNL